MPFDKNTAWTTKKVEIAHTGSYVKYVFLRQISIYTDSSIYLYTVFVDYLVKLAKRVLNSYVSQQAQCVRV